MKNNLSQPAAADPDAISDQTAAPSPLTQALRRGNLMASACPSRQVLKHITSRWGVLVLISLEGETKRFSTLRRTIGGVSERMLAQTLQSLEQDGLVKRTAHAVVPPHVDYALTPLGCEAAERVRLLADWIEINMPRISQAQRDATRQTD